MINFQVPDKWNSIDLDIENSKCNVPLTFEYELSWTAFLACGTPQQWISRGKWKKDFQKNFLIKHEWKMVGFLRCIECGKNFFYACK